MKNNKDFWTKNLNQKIDKTTRIIKIVQDYVENYKEEHIELISMVPIFDKNEISLWKKIKKFRKNYWKANESWRYYSRSKEKLNKEYKDMNIIFRIIFWPWFLLFNYQLSNDIKHFENKMNYPSDKIDKLMKKYELKYPSANDIYLFGYELIKKEIENKNHAKEQSKRERVAKTYLRVFNQPS